MSAPVKFKAEVPGIFFECSHGVFIDGNDGSLCYTTSKERADWIATMLNDLERVTAAVMEASVDMHRPSDRPCPTCEAVSKALRRPWGCYAYHVRIGRPPVPDFTQP